MEKFMCCICDNDLSVLVVSGVPTVDELMHAWQELFFEYCDLVEISEDAFVGILYMALETRKMHLKIVRNWLKILRSYKSRTVADCVEYLYPVKFNFEDDAKYNRALEEVESELRSLSFDIKVKQAEYDALNQHQSTKNDTVTRKFFATIMMRINNYLKMNPPIDKKSTVDVYGTALREYIAAVENAEKSYKNAGI